MENKVYTFTLDLNWDLLTIISRIDRFDASWTSLERKEGQSLKQLKSIATVRSVGASTRIEGSKMSNEEIEVLLSDIDITKIEDRDEQEALGYFNALDLISESYQDIEITESTIKHLHNILMKHSQKDGWHKGNYKQHTNSVEAIHPNGSRQIIFQTTEAGFPTEEAMNNLVRWYKNEDIIHPLVKCALFTYEFLSIHPFQDGNGRLSRLLSTLLLLKNGYSWIQYISFEHEVENKKTEYYNVLRSCQANRPNENVNEWINFFFRSLKNIQELLIKKLNLQGVESTLSQREKSILLFISNHPNCKSGEIARKLNIPNPSVKRMLSKLLSKNLIEKQGVGPSTSYTLGG